MDTPTVPPVAAPLLIAPCQALAVGNAVGPDGRPVATLNMSNPAVTAHYALTDAGVDELVERLRQAQERMRADAEALGIEPEGLQVPKLIVAR